MGKMDARRHDVNVGGFGRFTFSLSGENLSVSLSQDAPLSVPNGAVRGCMCAFTWLSGDVALLPLKSQNHRDVRFYSDGSAHPARGVFHVAFGEQSRDRKYCVRGFTTPPYLSQLTVQRSEGVHSFELNTNTSSCCILTSSIRRFQRSYWAGCRTSSVCHQHQRHDSTALKHMLKSSASHRKNRIANETVRFIH